MSLDLVIINPSAAHGIMGGHPIYGDLGDTLTAIEPPQWTRLIAGYIRDRKYSVQIIDAEALRLSPTQTAAMVRDLKPRLICIAVYGHMPSASTQQMVAAGETALEIKKVTDWPIVMVGGHPSALPGRTLREEAVDYVGVGEGPLTVLGLLRGDDRGAIPGLVYDNGGLVIKNASAPLIEDLRELHGHAWDLLPMDRYRAHSWQCLSDLSKRQPYASIYTSLNCPYKCSFCCISAPFGGNRYQMRNPSDVVDEIEYLYEEYGISVLKITDEMFILNQRHYTAICEGIIQRGLGSKLNLWAYARVDTVKPKTLDLLRAAGIQWLALGIESASKLVRDGAEKKLRTEDIIGTVKTIQAHGINVIGNFMFGLRDDTHVTMQRTYDLALECMPDFANFYSVQAYPGSALYDEALQKGWTLPQTWRSFSQHNDDCRPMDTEHLTGAEVLAFRDAAFNFFFTHPDYLAHVGKKFGAEAAVHILDMTKFKLKRKLLTEPQAA